MGQETSDFINTGCGIRNAKIKAKRDDEATSLSFSNPGSSALLQQDVFL